MWRNSMVKVVGATALFALVHSALASRQAKTTASKYLSERTRNALYRPFYLAQSAVTIAILVAYIRSLPNRTIYEIRGPLTWPFRLGQLSGLFWATASAYHVGFSEILGLRGLIEFSKGKAAILAEPEAQGPAIGSDGYLETWGPFRFSRHPLNFAPLPVMWLNPRMTTNLLAFNLIGTLYLIIGSRHEENRLRAAYAEPYLRYQESGVPFYLPSTTTKLLPSSEA